MGHCRKRQINHREYLQLRFHFEYEGQRLECFATAPIFMVPAKYLVVIQQIGLVDDIMLEPEEVESTLLVSATDEAYSTWVHEVSLKMIDKS